MDKLKIHGGIPLRGKVKISGAKNAALPLMAACLLSEEKLHLTNVPNLSDIHSLMQLLETLGVKCCFNSDDKTLYLQAEKITSVHADYELVRKMRASILALGPLVARQGEAIISLPGGCAIGTRPIDLHLKGLEALGARIILEEGYVQATAPKGLKGADFTFPTVSVTGTENLLMAATLAEGTTYLRNAAQEPEVSDLAHCLVKMGANIEGIGTSTLVIHGVKKLKGTQHNVIADRIETGTYIMGALITGGHLEIEGASLNLLPTVQPLLEKAGAIFKNTTDGFTVDAPHSIKAVDISTAPYPGFPTDLQAQFVALMCVAEGTSTVKESIFENRFMHVAELLRMGAQIQVHGSILVITGWGKQNSIKGAPVMATDLRASASLVLAGLAAEGETVVHRIYHLDRGYESMEEKLKLCGAHIERIH